MTQESNVPSANESPAQISLPEIFNSHLGGKLSIHVDRPLTTKRDLSIAYTPGVAQVSRAIAQDINAAEDYTWSSRLVAVISDGSAVLGLGNIGAKASLPVMEGKSALFKKFAELDSIPIVLDTSDVDEMFEAIVRIAPSFGAVNLEDISAPRCFELEERLIEALDMPVMHDDQHGTAVVVLAALKNAVKVVGKNIEDLRVVITGAGAAGVAVTEILLASGITDIIVTDSRGTIHEGREALTGKKLEFASRTNPRGVAGGTTEALQDADVFIGVSSAKIPDEQVATMAEGAIVFALSNPDPEILPEVAARYADVVATGRSDFPNQINNVLAFPGIFRGALDAGAKKITQEMKLAAADAIASLVGEDLASNYIIPSALDPRVAPAVAEAVKSVAK
ncbi:NAD(P)-dependent malic enzyme [Gulosibacter molinativorax]|uniref:NAD-dependent malic enzyme n=1 Tax=Gulosibacter molinativorax TaxID=256821 RepID=A0ABT7C7E1_9MICO|nr:malic enzyme-like NAD(P)-binding protein [Gulosibacter molinativorax]MDJ1371151.1 NAD-dependent malic enzyme [Gulosibacter molinativorax]QUY62967.1 Malate dehydrogenase (Oxaloacetate decarboxylating) [Gulosibacter molinativorax]